MEENKGTRLNNIMNRKVNMDFFKNINLPPIKLPKIKSRKIFNVKNPEKSERMAPPEPICIERSPSRISMVSGLYPNEPEPDYNPKFGRLSVTQSAIDIRPDHGDAMHDRKDNKTNKPLSFSEKLSKQCKEISEFKFRHILGKKTVVRQTTIDPNDYSYHLDDSKSVKSDYEFEFHSLPAAKQGVNGEFLNDDDDDIESVKGASKKVISRQSSTESYESKRGGKASIKGSTAAQRAGSMNFDGNVEPNKSSLFKQVKSLSLKRKSSNNEKHYDSKVSEKSSEDGVKPLKKQGMPKMSFNRQTFEDACSKAKTSVNNKIQKLKSLHIRRQNSETSAPTPDKYTKKSSPDVIFPNITYGSENDGVVRSLSPPAASSRPSSRGWVDQPVRQSSIDSMRAFPRRALRAQSSVDSTDDATLSSEPVRSASRYFESESDEEIDVTPKSHIKDNYGAPRPIRAMISRPLIAKGLLTSNIQTNAENIDQRPVSRSRIEPNWKLARPAPPVPPVKLSTFIGPTIDQVSKTDMIRQRFTQKQDTYNSSTYVHTSLDSDPDSWIPDVFKGPADNQINLSSIEEGDTAWSMDVKDRSIKKSVSVDIFNGTTQAPFDDFEEALKNVPTVNISTSNVARLSLKLKEQAVAHQKIVEEKVEEISTSRNSSVRNKRFNLILSRFESNSIEIGSDESINSILAVKEGSGTGVNVDTNANYPLVYATKPDIPQISVIPSSGGNNVKSVLNEVKLHISENEVTEPKADSTGGSKNVSKLLNNLNGIENKYPEEGFGVSPNQEPVLQEIKNEERPYLRRILKNEVTMSTSYDDNEEDVFHSLDYEDAEQIDSKPLSHRRSIKYVYTAEV